MNDTRRIPADPIPVPADLAGDGARVGAWLVAAHGCDFDRDEVCLDIVDGLVISATITRSVVAADRTGT